MKRIIIVTTALLAAQAGIAMGAPIVPMRDGYLLTMETTDAGGDTHTAPADGSDDDGAAAGDTHATHGDGKSAHADGDGAGADPAARAAPNADPAQPAATPRHPGYRWQSLIPGAIK